MNSNIPQTTKTVEEFMNGFYLNNRNAQVRKVHNPVFVGSKNVIVPNRKDSHMEDAAIEYTYTIKVEYRGKNERKYRTVEYLFESIIVRAEIGAYHNIWQ